MAAEAEASREAKAKIIAAQGEMNAAKNLKEAADTIASSSGDKIGSILTYCGKTVLTHCFSCTSTSILANTHWYCCRKELYNHFPNSNGISWAGFQIHTHR